MENPVTTRIDRDACTGCGSCVSICPSDTLALVDGKAAVVGTRSLHCDQCAAICPAGAITVDAVDPGALDLAAIALEPGRAADISALVGTLRARRSCRRYTDEPVARALLEDLVKIATMAPSGTNSQAWAFTVLPTRAAVLRLAEAIGNFFRRLNRLSERRALRIASRILGGGVLDWYHREYHDRVAAALDEWATTGRERLFHGAPAVLLIGARPERAACPAEDALLAAGNVLLAAEALGLGTCLVGFAVEALRRDRGIARRVGIPDDERVYAVIAVGHPAVRYARPAGRKRVVPRFCEG